MAESKKSNKRCKITDLLSDKRFIAVIFVMAVLALPPLFIKSLKILTNANFFMCANSISCLKDLRGTVEHNATGYFAGKYVHAPNISDVQDTSSREVLGEDTSSGEKHIYVDLVKQTLTAYEGDKIFMQTLVSTGKWYPTPIGEFRIWAKLRSTRMSGGEGADYYDLPNVPYTMYFEGEALSRSRGFAIHGAYWHNNFGHPMSHGCVNMREIDVKKLFAWAEPVSDDENTTHSSSINHGTRITISGEAPL